MLSERELATVLAALRLWQASQDGQLTNDPLWEIATGGGKFQCSAPARLIRSASG